MSRVPYSSNDYIGSANAAVLSGSITSTSSVISISGTTASWDSLGSTGGFVVAINYGTAIEEKVYIPSGSYAWGSPVVTISGVQRGYDNTTAAGQSDGFSVVHVLTATDLQEANKVVAGLLGNGSPLTVNPLTVSGSLTVSGAVSLNTPLGITDGGTGASSAASALSNLGALPLSGGTMTGALTLASDPSTALEAATKEYADTKLPLAGGTMTGALTLASAPSSSLQAATKSYVDATAQGLSIKQSCQEATTAALPANTYAAGVITITSTGILTVDGVTVALNDRVLVKNEAAAANNGIYLCTTAGATGVSAVLTRATDSNTSADIVGAFTFIENGTVNASSGWVNTNTGTITIGTTSITYTQFSGAGEITAGTGLTKSGNTLAIGSVITAGSVGSSSSIPVLNYNAEGQITGVSSAAISNVSPATTVTGPDAYGAAAVVGVSTEYARADHDHGLPAAPADIPLSTVTTAGDLIVGTGAGSVGRLPVGTSNQVLLGGSTPTWGAAPAPSLYEPFVPIFHQSTLPSNTYWNSVAYGNGVFVAVVQSSNMAAYSTNGGVTWTASTLPSSLTWNSVAYGNGTFVAVAQSSNMAAYSTNGGVTWMSGTLPSNTYWQSIAYGNGVFVAVAQNSTYAAYSLMALSS